MGMMIMGNREETKCQTNKKIMTKLDELSHEKMMPKTTLDTNQGGRSCAGARVAPAEKFGLGRKF